MNRSSDGQQLHVQYSGKPDHCWEGWFVEQCLWGLFQWSRIILDQGRLLHHTCTSPVGCGLYRPLGSNQASITHYKCEQVLYTLFPDHLPRQWSGLPGCWYRSIEDFPLTCRHQLWMRFSAIYSIWTCSQKPYCE